MRESLGIPDELTAPVSADALRVALWLDAQRTRWGATPWGEALEFGGVCIGDVLFSPLYQALLARVRGTAAAPAPHDALATRIARRLGRYRQERRAAKHSPALAPTEIVLWPRLPSHLRQQIPVAQALRAQGGTHAFVAGQAPIAETLRARGHSAVYLPTAFGAAAHAARRAAAARRDTLETAVSLPGGLGLAPKDVVATVQGVFQRHLGVAYEAVAYAGAVLETMQPRVLVVGNDVTIEGRAGTLVAARRGVASAILMHGTVAGHAHHHAHRADRILAYGEADRVFFEGLGVPAATIEVCGAPYLDDRPSQTEQLHPQVAALLGEQADGPYVLMATSGPGFSISHGHHAQTIEQVMRLSARRPDVVFVAKLHPKDRLAYYEEAAARVPGSRLRVVASTDGDLPASIFDWLQGCSAVLTGASTVAREALLMDVPVITMDFADEVHGIDFIEAEATLHVTDADALALALADLLERSPRRTALDQRARSYLTHSFHHLDGKAAQRCAEAIARLAAAPATPRL